MSPSYFYIFRINPSCMTYLKPRKSNFTKGDLIYVVTLSLNLGRNNSKRTQFANYSYIFPVRDATSCFLKPLLPRLLCQNDAPFLKSYLKIILLGWICAVHLWMLYTLRGRGFDCLLTLISIKMEHSQPLQVCTIVCIINDAYRGQGD